MDKDKLINEIKLRKQTVKEQYDKGIDKCNSFGKFQAYRQVLQLIDFCSNDETSEQPALNIADVMHILKEFAYEYITEHGHRDKNTDEILESELQPTKVKMLMNWIESTIKDLEPLDYP